jgi:hypothetical protein
MSEDTPVTTAFERYASGSLDEDFYKWAYPSEPPPDAAARNAIYDARQGTRDSAGDEMFELLEKKRHRTMIWELVATYCTADKFTPWHGGYYKGEAVELLKHQTPFHDTGYGPPSDDANDRQAAPAAATFDKFRSMHPIPKAPGLNFAPDHDPAALDDEQLIQAWDGIDDVLTDFGGVRGQYELFTDFFVDICDGFRGAYINGDMREIAKCPVKENYTWVGSLTEQLLGLKNGWAWTAIQGTKEEQCATLGGYEFGRLIDTGSYFDYRGDPADFHPSDPDPDNPGQQKGDTAAANSKDHRFGNWEDFGVVAKEYTGPLNDDETPNFDESFNSDGTYVTGSIHGTVSETKHGYGAPGSADVNYTKEITSNKRSWAKTDVGGGAIIEEEKTSGRIWSNSTVGGSLTEEEITGGQIYSKTMAGGYVTEETITGGMSTTTTTGNVTETLTGNLVSTHNGAMAETFNGAAASSFIGAQSEFFMGGQAGFSLAGMATAEVSAKLEFWLGVAISISLGISADIYAGGKTEISTTKFVIGGAEVKLGATKKEIALAMFLGL